MGTASRPRLGHVLTATAVLAVVFVWAQLAHRTSTREAALLTEGLVIAAATPAALVLVRPGRAVVLPYVLTIAVSFTVYALPPGPAGRDHFDARLLGTIVAAGIVAALSAVRARSGWDVATRALVCALGAATPPLVAAWS